MTKYKKQLYNKAVIWIALNDEPTDLNVYSVQDMISVCLVADLFEVEALEVAKDIVIIRQRDDKPVKVSYTPSLRCGHAFDDDCQCR